MIQIISQIPFEQVNECAKDTLLIRREFERKLSLSDTSAGCPLIYMSRFWMTQNQSAALFFGGLGFVGMIVETIRSVITGYCLASKHESGKDRQQTIAYLKAIRAELKTIGTAYMKGPGKNIEERISTNEAKRPLGRHPTVSDSFFHGLR